MKKRTTSKTRKTGASKSKHKKPVRKKIVSKRKKTVSGKVSTARKIRMKKTIATLKNGLKALEKEVNK